MTKHILILALLLPLCCGFKYATGTYSGTGSVNIGWQPDVVLTKCATAKHPLIEVSGETHSRFWVTTTGETANHIDITATGFDVGTSSNVNCAGFYLALGEDSHNDLDVFSYSGNDTDDRDITLTNLGSSTPNACFVVSTGTVTPVWRNSSMSAGDSISNLTSSTQAANMIQAFGSGTMQVGTNSAVNASGNTYYGWCMTGTNGNAVGTYTGNATDNRSITGFGITPIFAQVKCDSTTGLAYRFSAESGDASFISAAAEAANAIQGFISGGMQIGNDSAVNVNSTSCFYWAIAPPSYEVAMVQRMAAPTPFTPYMVASGAGNVPEPPGQTISDTIYTVAALNDSPINLPDKFYRGELQEPGPQFTDGAVFISFPANNGPNIDQDIYAAKLNLYSGAWTLSPVIDSFTSNAPHRFGGMYRFPTSYSNANYAGHLAIFWWDGSVPNLHAYYNLSTSADDVSAWDATVEVTTGTVSGDWPLYIEGGFDDNGVLNLFGEGDTNQNGSIGYVRIPVPSGTDPLSPTTYDLVNGTGTLLESAPGCVMGAHISGSTCGVAWGVNKDNSCSGSSQYLWYVGSTDSCDTWASAAGTGSFAYDGGGISPSGGLYSSTYRVNNNTGYTAYWTDLTFMSDGTPLVADHSAFKPRIFKWNGSSWDGYTYSGATAGLSNGFDLKCFSDTVCALWYVDFSSSKLYEEVFNPTTDAWVSETAIWCPQTDTGAGSAKNVHASLDSSNSRVYLLWTQEYNVGGGQGVDSDHLFFVARKQADVEAQTAPSGACP